MSPGEPQPYDRASDLGPRGLELRSLLDEFAAARGDDPITWVAVPALVALARWQRELLVPASAPPWTTRLRHRVRERLRPLHGGRDRPGDYYLAGGALFRADGPNHLHPAEPVMRRLGEPIRPAAELRASEQELDAGTSRARRLAEQLLETARERGVWIPPDLPHLRAIFVNAAHDLAHAEALVDALSPRAVIVLATPNPGPRALVHVAREAGVPSLYFPHAPPLMDATLNDLPTDFAGLRGPREVDYYSEAVGRSDRLEVIGDPGIEAEEVPDHDPSLPPVFAPPIEAEPVMREVIDVVHAAVGESLLVSPHPEADVRRLRSMLPGAWEVWTDRTYELLRRGPPAIIQFTSGVALEALMLGIPTIELRVPADRTITYPLIREPQVRFASNAEELRAAVEAAHRDAKSDTARGQLRDWGRGWSSPHGEEAAALGADLVERAAAAPPPGPIWSAWP